MELQKQGPDGETARVRKATGYVHCPICTRTVEADVLYLGKRMKVGPGQKCGRCHSSLDAAAVLYLRAAA